MQLEHSFTVPVGIDEAWAVLLDIERIAPCMPGAAIDTVDGDDFTGTVKVKLGPIGLTYKGKASFVEKDAGAHVAVIHAQGRDARGNGTASAKITARLTDADGRTKVDVLTDLDITGKPAQFGRGVMADVGNKLLGQFADCLAGQLAGGSAADAPTESLPAAAPPDATTAELPAGSAAKKAPAKKAAAKKAPAKQPSTAASADAPEKKAPAKKVAAATTSGTATASVNGVAAASESAAVVGEKPSAVAESPAAAQAARQLPQRDVEPIDLMQHAGPAVAKRLAPVLGALLLLLILVRLLRRR